MNHCLNQGDHFLKQEELLVDPLLREEVREPFQGDRLHREVYGAHNAPRSQLEQMREHGYIAGYDRAVQVEAAEGARH